MYSKPGILHNMYVLFKIIMRCQLIFLVMSHQNFISFTLLWRTNFKVYTDFGILDFN